MEEPLGLHGRFTRHLIFSGEHLANPQPMKELPRAFVDKIRALNFEAIKQAVGGDLTRQEIESVLARRELLLGEIDEEIGRRGEKALLY